MGNRFRTAATAAAAGFSLGGARAWPLSAADMASTLLVTGSSGLIGSEVCAHFANLGWAIHGVDNNQRAVFFGRRGGRARLLDGGAVVGWLFVVALCAVLAALLPALRAARLTVRDALSEV